MSRAQSNARTELAHRPHQAPKAKCGREPKGDELVRARQRLRVHEQLWQVTERKCALREEQRLQLPSIIAWFATPNRLLGGSEEITPEDDLLCQRGSGQHWKKT